MRKPLLFFVVLAIIFFIILNASKPQTESSEITSEDVVNKGEFTKFIFETKYGNITFKLLPDAAPKTVAQWREALKRDYFRGCHFYRFEPNFVLQGGCHHDPNHERLPELPLEYTLPNVKGTVSMARTKDPNSATSEFAIQLKDNSEWLGPGGSDQYGYSVFMLVTNGWDVVENIMQHKSDGKVDIQRTHILNK
eukprot:TRINITY_DN3578_c0_g1_i2.p1 TRINITY_DN3578_c0_g1~~TRINITY_DN3578_c0_g1_i2.p1  ORF type:complete len:194 (-),score=19.02 TRINITY_DN3578_c0_g1_i2:49-630(-)